MTGGMTGEMKTAKVLYIKGLALSDGRDEGFFSLEFRIKSDRYAIKNSFTKRSD